MLLCLTCRANAQYEGVYLLGTSIARPLIAKRQIEIAKEVRVLGAGHTCTCMYVGGVCMHVEDVPLGAGHLCACITCMPGMRM